MRKALIVACSMFAAFSTGTVAHARVGDAQWAACAWQTDAQAANNWLKMQPPKWQDDFGTPSELLGLRLMAMCDATPADPKKPNRVPNWKSAQQQLKRSQPKILPASDKAPVEARLCKYFAVKDNARALYLAEAVRVAAQVSTTVHQVYFDQAGSNAVKVVDYADRPVRFQYGAMPENGKSIRMPQDTLIASPSEGYASEKLCQIISADGILVDA